MGVKNLKIEAVRRVLIFDFLIPSSRNQYYNILKNNKFQIKLKNIHVE
jgi:hypothetical protein